MKEDYNSKLFFFHYYFYWQIPMNIKDFNKIFTWLLTMEITSSDFSDSSSATSVGSWAKTNWEPDPGETCGFRRNLVGKFGDPDRTNRSPICGIGNRETDFVAGKMFVPRHRPLALRNWLNIIFKWLLIYFEVFYNLSFFQLF